MISSVPAAPDRATPGRVAIIVPARFASTRYPGKPLVMLRGADGRSKPLIQRSWEAACRVSGVNLVYVATDDDRIREAAEGFGARVLMTPEGCINGTERCAATLPLLPDDVDIIVNLQGDAPLTPPGFVTALVGRLAADHAAGVATPVVRCPPDLHRRLLDDQSAGRVGGTTAVFSGAGRALYFSKRVLPYMPDGRVGEPDLPVFLHVGLYAYRRAALNAYVALPSSPLELLEGLEQLRFLEADMSIDIVQPVSDVTDFWELNNPSDVAVLERLLSTRGIG
jgi:3-deoxy-manno-octulosonate cytidylyltransferase (CMP-KDO synthetase)